ncbi:hypothetical protein DMB38_20515 [Streptomyces sp. WAC 06738]|uniref:hypothetical protein n=1 Tax=Streptomyces sp. WAC 06738 TaxID=2203210 RepID=UPI000F6C932A|nr:hypothetical protein [Streptomyces sp. WAC 06738]AZM47854.1 hypothetical protein DMB38_20515 [Streptomyces sp. WAC 06738]
MIGTRVGAEGWTIVDLARQKHYDDRYYGQFLGAREHGPSGGMEWVVGRLFVGKSRDDVFRDGEWAYSKRFAGPRSTDSADAALEAYVKMSHETFVWDRIFEQRTGEVIDRYLAGPEVADAPKLSAGWQQSSANGGMPVGSHTVYLPFHQAKYYLLHFLRATQLSAMQHLTQGITLDRHQAVDLVTKATGPVRFEYGYHTYWLAAEPS